MMLVIPADWSPDTAFRRLDLAPMVIQIGAGLGPLGLISWYEVGLESTGPDPRFNLTLPMGLGDGSRRAAERISRWSAEDRKRSLEWARGGSLTRPS